MGRSQGSGADAPRAVRRHVRPQLRRTSRREPARRGNVAHVLPRPILDLALASPVGLIDSRSVLRAGYTSWDLTAWVDAGLLERIVLGWYRVAGHPVPPAQCLHLPLRYLERRQRNWTREPGSWVPPAALTGAAATAAYGARTFPLPLDPDVLVEQHRRVRVADPPFRVHHTDMRALRWRRLGDLVLADPARTLRDLAADPEVTDVQVRTTVDALVNLLRLRVVDLIAEWTRLGGRGARRLLAMAASGTFDVESEGERVALATLFEEFPPAPDCQVWIAPDLRVDFVFVFAALILEYYGEEAHAGTVDRDGRRVWRLRRGHFDALIITKGMLRDRVELASYIHDVRRQRERDMLAGRIPRPPLPAQPGRRTPLRTLVPLG